MRIGTAGWSLPAAFRDRFPPGDSLLQRYAGVFDAVEINSSFYRPHRRRTYARWAASTPENFRFAAKVPREITHERRLMDTDAAVDRFVEEIDGLGEKLGCVLIQLPPSLSFEPQAVERFFKSWRGRFKGLTALEPRHPSWLAPAADGLLARYRVARVAADPAMARAAAQPGGWRGFAYYRLHGSPQMYVSSYDEAALARLAATAPGDAWIVFDNTKFGAATENALDLKVIGSRRRPRLSPEPAYAR